MKKSATHSKNPVFLRYWGSYPKSAHQAMSFAAEFAPLIKGGWICHLVLEREPDVLEWLDPIKKQGVNFEFVSRARSQIDYRVILAVRTICLKIGCDVFHCDNIHTSPLLGAALAGVPVRFWRKHAMNAHYEECREPSLKERIAFMTRLSTALSTKVLAVSSAVAREIENLGIDPNKILVINNPHPSVKISDKSRSEMRSGLGLDSNSIVFISVGRMERVKGWDLLVDAFLSLADKYSHARLLLVGEYEINSCADFGRIVKSSIVDSKHAEKILLLGHRTDIGDIMTTADVFVLSSRSEGYCDALLEALASGLPTVSTKVGIAEEVIHDGNGLLVERNSSIALAQGLQRFLVDDSLLNRIKVNIRIPDHIPSQESHANDLQQLYRSALIDSISPSKN